MQCANYAEQRQRIIDKLKVLDYQDTGSLPRETVKYILLALNPGLSEHNLDRLFDETEVYQSELLRYELFINWLFGHTQKPRKKDAEKKKRPIILKPAHIPDELESPDSVKPVELDWEAERRRSSLQWEAANRRSSLEWEAAKRRSSLEWEAAKRRSSLPCERTTSWSLQNGSSDSTRAESNSNVDQNHLFHDLMDAEKLIVITDVGEDNDDEMALCLMSDMVAHGLVEPLAVVANLRPAHRRAALARGTLDMLGLSHVPVGIGTDGGSSKHEDNFSKYITESTTGIDYIAGPLEAVAKIQKAEGTDAQKDIEVASRIFDGQRLLHEQLQQAEQNSLTLVLLSSIKDAAQLLRAHEDLFVSKVKCVAIMGGVAIDGSTQTLLPDDAHNNSFCIESARYFYQRCQELGVPMYVLTRHAAYGCKVKRCVYDLMVRCPVPNPVACRLHRAQQDSIQRLWHSACIGGRLPARCDQKWFRDTFCGGDGDGRGSEDSIWDIVKTFNMYDPLTILLAVPKMRAAYFCPEIFLGPAGSENYVIGIDKAASGIHSSEKLCAHLLSTFVTVAGRKNVLDEKPSALRSLELTSAVETTATHSPEFIYKLVEEVQKLLDNEWLALKNSSLLGTWRQRDQLMRSIGPAMVLVTWACIEELGRIPHSAERKTISMEQAADLAAAHEKRFFIEMFSHRWYTGGALDDPHNSKAKALVEWGKYRYSMGLLSFFWVDYACIDQNDISPGVAMLPLYVASCNNIVCYDTPPYETRAWCRVERLMFTSFVAPNIEYISADFQFDETDDRLPSGELVPKVEARYFVPDPLQDDSQLTYDEDRQLIANIKVLCKYHWGLCWKDGLMEIASTKGGLESLASLQFGKTQVRIRKYGKQTTLLGLKR